MTIPSEVRGILAIGGWLILALSILRYGWGFFLKKYGEKLDRDFSKKVITDPNAALQQIIELEATVSRKEIEYKREQATNQGMLKYLVEKFNERFPYTNLEAFRQHIAKKSSANR